MTAEPNIPRPAPPSDRLRLVGELGLTPGRVHEFCGSARQTAAVWVMAGTEGPVIWIASASQRDRLHGQGLAALMDPGRIVFVSPRRVPDLLWSMEEALRAGVVPLVVAELPVPPALTPVRRLTLAAETGAEIGAATGLRTTGLLLTPGPGGAAGVESRWHLAPRHKGETRAWSLERRRARMEPPRTWAVRAQGDRLELCPALPAILTTK